MLDDDLFNMVTKLKTISDWHEFDDLIPDLRLLEGLLQNKKDLSPLTVERLKDLIQKLVSIYDEQPDKPDMDRINPLIWQILEVIQSEEVTHGGSA